MKRNLKSTSKKSKKRKKNRITQFITNKYFVPIVLIISLISSFVIIFIARKDQIYNLKHQKWIQLTQKKTPYLYLGYNWDKNRVGPKQINIGLQLINKGEEAATNILVIFPPLKQANLMLLVKTTEIYRCYGRNDTIFINLEDRTMHPIIGEPVDEFIPIIFNITIRAQNKEQLETLVLHYIVRCGAKEFPSTIYLNDIINLPY